jgi:hypothetical protein
VAVATPAAAPIDTPDDSLLRPASNQSLGAAAEAAAAALVEEATTKAQERFESVEAESARRAALAAARAEREGPVLLDDDEDEELPWTPDPSAPKFEVGRSLGGGGLSKSPSGRSVVKAVKRRARGLTDALLRSQQDEAPQVEISRA